MSDERPGNAVSEHEDYAELTAAQASRLLSSVLGGERRAQKHPAEALLEELRRPHAPEWFGKVFAASLGMEPARAEELLLRGAADLETLVAMKDAGKRARPPADGSDAPAIPTLAYFLAHAAALAHHKTFIGKEEKRRYLAVLQELADVVPSPWAELFSKARDELAALV